MLTVSFHTVRTIRKGSNLYTVDRSHRKSYQIHLLSKSSYYTGNIVNSRSTFKKITKILCMRRFLNSPTPKSYQKSYNYFRDNKYLNIVNYHWYKMYQLYNEYCEGNALTPISLNNVPTEFLNA